MPDDQPAGATPEGEGATPATPDSQGQPAKGDDQLGPSGLAALQRERDAREAAQRELDKLAKRVKAYEDKDKSESEKNAERIAELEREVETHRKAARTATLQVATTSAARKLGFRDPDLASRLISDEVEFTDSGEPRNIDKLLTDLAKAHPYLLSGTTGGGDAGLGPRGAPAGANDDINTMIRRAAGRA